MNSCLVGIANVTGGKPYEYVYWFPAISATIWQERNGKKGRQQNIFTYTVKVCQCEETWIVCQGEETLTVCQGEETLTVCQGEETLTVCQGEETWKVCQGPSSPQHLRIMYTV